MQNRDHVLARARDDDGCTQAWLGLSLEVEELEAVLADPESGAEAMEAIRSMIAGIVLSPAAAGGMEAMLEGDLVQIQEIWSRPERSNAALCAGVLDLCWRVKCRWMRARITPCLLAAAMYADASHTPKPIIQHTI